MCTKNIIVILSCASSSRIRCDNYQRLDYIHRNDVQTIELCLHAIAMDIINVDINDHQRTSTTILSMSKQIEVDQCHQRIDKRLEQVKDVYQTETGRQVLDNRYACEQTMESADNI
jgi:hypothetical protein